MKQLTLFLLCLILTNCSNPKKYDNNMLEKVMPKKEIGITNYYEKINNLFPLIDTKKAEKISINIKLEDIENLSTKEKHIDTLEAYPMLRNFLTFKSRVNCDFYAMSSFEISKRFIAYLIRQPASVESTKICLYLYDINFNKVIQQVELADYVGDEGFETLTKSVIHFNNFIKIETEVSNYDNGKLIDKNNYCKEWGDSLFTSFKVEK